MHDVNQFLHVEKSAGKAILNDVQYDIADGSVVVVPAGVKHNIVNTGAGKMRLYTFYICLRTTATAPSIKQKPKPRLIPNTLTIQQQNNLACLISRRFFP